MENITYIDWASIISLILTVIALVVSVFLSYKQSKEAENLTANLTVIGDGLTSKLTLISDTLSTRYLGEFPDFLPEIINVLTGAQNKVVIVCDFPTYGRFSKPDLWLDYKHIIEKITESSKVSISFVCLESKARIDFSRKQFFHKPPTEEQWEKFCSEPVFHLKMKPLLIRNGLENKLPLPTFNEFINLLEKEDNDMLQITFSNIKYILTPDPMPLYFWISDDKTGVFSFPSYESDKSEFGFVTSDQKLIASFLQIHESYKISS